MNVVSCSASGAARITRDQFQLSLVINLLWSRMKIVNSVQPNAHSLRIYHLTNDILLLPETQHQAGLTTRTFLFKWLNFKFKTATMKTLKKIQVNWVNYYYSHYGQNVLLIAWLSTGASTMAYKNHQGDIPYVGQTIYLERDKNDLKTASIDQHISLVLPDSECKWTSKYVLKMAIIAQTCKSVI